MLYRGLKGRTTDGEKVWQHTQKEYVTPHLTYKVPVNEANAAAASAKGNVMLAICGLIFSFALLIVSLVIFSILP